MSSDQPLEDSPPADALGRPPEELLLPRVTLRRHRLEDAAGLFAAVQSDRERLLRFLPWVARLDRLEDEERFVRDMRRAWDEASLFDYGIHPHDSLLARHPDAPAVAGTVGTHSIEWERRQCELGYWLHGAWEGLGFIQEAIAALERELFTLGFERVEIRCDADNERSAATARRAGYVLEGRLRHHRPRGDGSWADTLVFSRLASDPPRGPSGGRQARRVPPPQA